MTFVGAMLEPSYGLEDERPPPSKGRACRGADRGRRVRGNARGCASAPVVPPPDQADHCPLALLLIAGSWCGNGRTWSLYRRCVRPRATLRARRRRLRSQETQSASSPAASSRNRRHARASVVERRFAQKVVLSRKIGRSQRQALRRLGDLADRDRDTGPVSRRSSRSVPTSRCRSASSPYLGRSAATPTRACGSHTSRSCSSCAGFSRGGFPTCPHPDEQAESTRGVPLAGLASRSRRFYSDRPVERDADKERNLQLLKERGWFDIPVVYSNNRAHPGHGKRHARERAFAEAFKLGSSNHPSTVMAGTTERLINAPATRAPPSARSIAATRFHRPLHLLEGANPSGARARARRESAARSRGDRVIRQPPRFEVRRSRH